MKKSTALHNNRKFSVYLLTALTVVLFNISAFGQGGAKWATGLNSIGAGDAFGTSNNLPIIIKVNNTLRGSFTNTGFDVYGTVYSTNAVVDSILSSWQVMVSDALSVGGNLSVSGNATVSGFFTAGQITINGNGITSASGNIDLGNNNVSTTGTITGSNITSLANDVSGLQATTANQQAEIDSLQSTVSNIQPSQWQNDSINPMNIFYSSGNVGIGISDPSEMFEVNGRVKISGSVEDSIPKDSLGNPLPQPKDSLGKPIPFPPGSHRSIIIDGGIDRITATSGTLDFDNTNLTTTGSFQSNSITTANLTIIDKIESDSMHARKSIEINNSLRLLRDTSVMYAEMSTKDTAVALILQKDAAAPVVIGDAPAPPPGESRAKLTVAGNTKLDGQLNVSGNIISSGTISANNVSIENDFTANKIISNRITSTDSILWIGDSSLGFMGNVNRIIGSTSGFYRGLGLGVNTTVRGLRSTAIGKNVKTEVDGENAVVIGSGMGNTETTLLTNNIPNSLMVGFNTSGNAPTLFVGPADGTANSIGEVGVGTSNPEAKLDIRVPSSPGNQYAAMFKTTNNDGIFIIPKLEEDGFNYHSKAGDAGIFWDGYNPLSGLVIGPWYSDGWRGLRISNEGLIGIGTSDPSEKLQIEDGSIYIKGESQGVIIDDGVNKRVGLIKYPGHAAGIWRTTGQSFEIGRTNVSSLPGSPTSYITDLLIGGDGNISINDANDIKLRNTHHGLGWYGDPNGNSPGDKNFATVNIDGPVLYGWKGGALGVKRLEYDESLYQDVEIERIALRWDEWGNVGIGTTEPDEQLHISGVAPAIHLVDYAAQGATTDTTSFVIRADNGAARLISNQSVAIFINGDNNDDNRTFEIKDNGNFYGGTVRTLFQVSESGNGWLYGKFKACEAELEVLQGCDFVFENHYSLLSWEKRMDGIYKNKHLPYIAPAKIMETEGMNVSATVLGLLRNIEEHDLYMDAQNKETKKLKIVITSQNEKIEIQQKQILQLSEAIDELKKEMEILKAEKK